MALIQRVNSNFPPLLSTFYCKCTLNITRFKTQQKLNNRSRSSPDERVNKDYRMFDKMIRYRQKQAKKSIVVKMPSMSCLQNLHSLCARFSRVVNIFPYTTSNQQYFVLMEFESFEDVTVITDMTYYKGNSDAAHTVTPVFSYNSMTKMSQANSTRFKPPSTKLIPYSNFEVPSLEEITKQLKKLNSGQAFYAIRVYNLPEKCTNGNCIQDRASSYASEQILMLHKLISVTDLNVRLRFHTAQQISYFVSRLFLNVEVVPFGSSISGFGQTGCDLDLLCTVWRDKKLEHNMDQLCLLSRYVHLTSREHQKHFLEIISTIIKACLPGSRNIKKILEARVPIIKFTVAHTNMECDLSSANMLALHMTELLYTYGELDWRVRPLVCTIRNWARVATLTKETPGKWISNFSLTLLIIYYLQTKRVIPSISTMKKEFAKQKKHMVNSESEISWFVNWRKSVNSNEAESLYNLLLGFFEFYSIFNFQSQGICVQTGVLRPKKLNSPLYIYNPLDESLNVSKNVDSYEMLRIICNFQKALNILEESNEQTAITKLINPNTFVVSNSTMTVPLFSSNTTSSGIEDSVKHSTNTNQSELIDKELFASKTNDIDTSKKVEQSIIK